MKREIITREKELAVECFPLPENSTLTNVIISDLVDTAKSFKNCIALSSNQIGYCARIFVIKQKDNFMPIINPRIISKTGGHKSMKESCMSRPEKEPVTVRRHKNIRLEFENAKGETIQKDFSGNTSRAIQHMLDHLNGKLV